MRTLAWQKSNTFQGFDGASDDDLIMISALEHYSLGLRGFAPLYPPASHRAKRKLRGVGTLERSENTVGHSENGEVVAHLAFGMSLERLVPFSLAALFR